MNNSLDQFISDLNTLNITLNDQQISQFVNYFDLLVDWNSRMNLTSITEFDQVLKKHFVDSISLLSYESISSSSKIIDVGTGAGFPGIPLKILLPDTEIVLMDSLNKRITFLNEVISNLNLKNICAIHSRAEDLSRNNNHREAYDYCVSRAVANLSTLSEYCLPFVKLGGKFISYKSGDYDKELSDSKNAINILGGNILKVESFNLPDTDISRAFVFIEKVNKTTLKYPRKGALPKNKPL